MDGVALDGLGLRDDKCPHQTVQDDLAVFVGAVEAHTGGHAAVIVHHRAVRLGDGKLHPLQGLVGDGIQLVDDKAALGLVEYLQGVGLVVFHSNSLGGIVQQVSALGLYLLDDIGARFQTGDGNIAVAVGTVFPVGGPHHRAVCSRHLEGHIGQGLLGHAIHLFNEQAALGGVGDDYRLGVSALPDDYIGGGGVDGVPLRGSELCQDIGAGGQVGNTDFSISIRLENPSLGQSGVTDHTIQAHFTPGCRGDAELGSGQRLAGHAVLFLDDQGSAGVIFEGKGDGAARLDLDGLGLGVDLVSVRGSRLRDDDTLARLQALDADLSIFVRPVNAVAVPDQGAVRIGDFELGVRQGHAGIDGAHFADQ